MKIRFPTFLTWVPGKKGHFPGTHQQKVGERRKIMETNDERYKVPFTGIKRRAPISYNHLAWMFNNSSDYGKWGEENQEQEDSIDD